MYMRKILLCLLVLAGAVQLSLADIRLPKLVDDNMVLRRGQPIHIWGWADPGEHIEISFDGKRYETATTGSGKWAIVLPSMKAGGPYDMVLTGGNRIELKNILIGDVWVCSGQSNMAFSVQRALDPEN